jgi:hypothetical protein
MSHSELSTSPLADAQAVYNPLYTTPEKLGKGFLWSETLFTHLLLLLSAFVLASQVICCFWSEAPETTTKASNSN